mmetsp:Transcript_93297/g.237422  ORF Transcript_93297/g.237422 Transcript_93297/m.237422 type:complete len:482 (-) Transcript_93297:14-1459(-)
MASAAFRLCTELTPRNFQEYSLCRSLVGSPKRLDGVTAEDSEGADASTLGNNLRAAPIPTAPDRFLSASSKAVCEVRSDCATSLAEGPIAGDDAGFAVTADGSLLHWRGSKLVYLDEQRHARTARCSPANAGHLVAACDLSGGRARAVFCRQAEVRGSPVASYHVSIFELEFDEGGAVDIPSQSSQRQPLPEPLVQLVGSAPLLAAHIEGEGCLLVANGEYKENASAVAVADETAAARPALAEQAGEDDEVDDDLRQLLHDGALGPGASLPPRAPAPAPAAARPIAVLTRISTSPSHDGRRAHIVRLGRAAVAASVVERAVGEDAAVVVILHAPGGHGAVVRCTLRHGEEATDGGIRSTHIDTFAGLAVLCQTPGFAYVLLSPDGTFAAVARWQGAISVELFAHPRGASTGWTQQLQLPKGAALRGVHLTESSVYLLHSHGLDRYAVAMGTSGGVSDEVADWGPPPVALPCTDGDWGEEEG